ncbi:hypothetical protein SSPS47_26775 [Streptomyces sp. S4.7]|nr:hypothetical protein SSPS47_26775 [Streptomyces sp. S4.7]
MGLMSWLRGDRSAAHVADATSGAAQERGDQVDVRRPAPMQRTVLGQDLVIDPAGFQGALSTRQQTALGSPLGHLVSPDAPVGVVHGLAAPAPPHPGPSAQRSVEMPMRRAAEGGKRVDVGAGMPEAVVASAEVPASVPALVSVPAPVPVQRASASMTTAGTSAAADLPVRQLIGEQAHLPVSAPPKESAVQRAPEPPADPRPRRAPGLGAPLPGLPPTAQRQAAASVPGRGAPETPSDPVGPPVVAPLPGDDPLVGAVSGEGEGGDEAPSPSAAVQRSLDVSGPVPAMPTVPLLGDRPLPLRTAGVEATSSGGPAASVQRDVEGEGGPAQTVPVRWTMTSRPDIPARPGLPPPPHSSAPVPVPLQRSAVVPLASTRPAPAPAAVPVQRRTSGGGPPVPGSLPRNDGGARLPTAGAFAAAAGVAQRMPDGSVVFGSAAGPPSGTSRPVVQRDAELTEEPPPPDPDSTSASDPVPNAEPEPVGESDAPAPPAGAVPEKAGTPVVTDELVRALYAPLSRLFKADLRLERERAGFLINTRH